jgi:hypothetical protein
MSDNPLPSSLLASILGLGALSLVACSSASSARMKSAVPASGTCPADPAWLTSSTLPTEVAASHTACDFEQFMWQSMLALVQPTADRSRLEFETWMPSYGIFVKDGVPTPWGQEPPTGCPNVSKGTGRQPRLYSDIILQAGADQPLMDPNHELVYYGMSVDKSAYDMMTKCELYRANCAGPLQPGNKGIDLIQKYPNLALPDTAVELKTSWMVVDEATAQSGRFYVVPGLIQHHNGPCREVQLGLVGMHIVSKTPQFPALIWATFENRNNAPDCDKTSASPPLGGSWNFYNPSCTNCTTNTYKPDQPAQVCRMHPAGDSAVGTFPGGTNCQVNPNQFACQSHTREILDESTKAIQAINSSVEALIRAPENAGKINTVWANYELVGNVWTVHGTVPPYLQAQEGALSASNTSMETFVQNGVAGATNPYSCLSCHNMQGPTASQNLPPVGLSHLFDNVQLPGGCADGRLPEVCGPYTHGH